MSATGSTGARRDAPSSWRFPQHSVVEVHGLQGAPELNGKHGVVTDFNAEKQRYVVFVAGALKSLKADNLKAQVGTTGTSSTSSSSEQQRQQQKRQQQGQGSSTSSSAWSSSADKFAAYTEGGKRKCLDAWKSAKRWTMSEGREMWRSSPIPKMILTFAVLGFAVYWISLDPKYARNAGAARDYATPKNDYDTYRDESYQRQDSYRESARDDRRQAQAGYDNYNTGHDNYGSRGYDEYDNYGSSRNYGNQYGGGGHHYHQRSYGGGSGSGFSTGMMLMLAMGAYYAYKQGWFNRLRGMDWMQTLFLFSMLSNLFGGGMRMGRCGLGGLGGMMGGRRRGFF